MMRKMLTFLLVLCLIVGMLPLAASAEEGNVAKIGDTEYATLADAVSAVHAKEGEDRMSNTVITLLRDASGGGIGAGYESISGGTTDGNNPVSFTLDLNGHTYTVEAPAVGSSGTETNGFQLLKGSVVVIKNGSIDSSLSNNILIQNYCNLTLEDVNLTATGASYVLSDNCGEVNIKGSTSITAGTGKVAFDVCGYSTYTGVTVTVDTTGTITGKIELTRSKGNENPVNLNIKNGNFVGTIDKQDTQANISITGGTFTSDVKDYCATGYTTKESDGKWDVVATTGMKASANASEGTASATVGGTYVGTEDDNNVSVEDKTIQINVTTNNAGAATNVTTTNVTIEPATLTSVANTSAVSAVEITTDVGTLKVDSDAWSSIAGNADENSAVTLSIEKKDGTQSSGSLIYTLTAEDANGNKVFADAPETNGEITVTVSYTGSEEPAIYYLPENGGPVKVEEVKLENSKLSWIVSHFSDYVVTKSDTVALVTTTSGTTTATTEHSTLSEALSAAKDGDTITLVKDITLDAPSTGLSSGQGAINITTDITLDGNGKTITAGKNYILNADGTRGEYHVINVIDGANVTIQNLTINGGLNGTLDSVTSAPRSGINVFTANGGSEITTVTLKNVRVMNCSAYGVTSAGSNLTVNGLTTSGNLWGGINLDNTASSATGGTFKMTEGNIGEMNSLYIENSKKAEIGQTATISGGTFAGFVSVAKQAGENEVDVDGVSLEITGGTFPTGLDINDYIPEGYEQNSAGVVGKEPSPGPTPSGPSDDEEEEEPTLPFVDVAEGAWYYEAVKYVYENGLMAGTDDDAFSPNVTLSRAMVAQILYNLEGKPDVATEDSFSDAAGAGQWALNAIAWAKQTSVVSGYEDDTFRPSKAVSREELAQMLYNYAQYKKITLPAVGDLSKFPDGDKVSSWAETAMSWATGLGVINGYEDETLRPGGSTTRAESASMIKGMDETLIK
jgi:hypothetical protein